MVLELEELQRKKTELANELQSLSNKEEMLSEINGSLEERLTVKSKEKIEPTHEVFGEFADERVDLMRLIERFNTPKGYSRNRGKVQDKQGWQQRNDVVAKEQTGPTEIGLRSENRVRLRDNVVFSWSFQKLSKE